VAEEAVAHGLRVAMIEAGPLGGTCLNRGCIPSKMLIRSADVMETACKAHIWGVNLQVQGVDWAHLVDRVVYSVDEDAREVEQRIGDANITLVRTMARFVGPKLIQAGDERLTAERVVIAAGSRPNTPEVSGLADVTYLTSDNAMRLPSQPGSLIIVGGGDVAAELAHFFGGLGTHVTIVSRSGLLLGHEDAEVARRFTEVYKRKFRLITKAEVTGVCSVGEGVRLELSQDGQRRGITGHALLFATGRTPNTDTLNVAATGVQVDERGFIQANQYLETAVPGVWTLGDIAGRFMLRHSANLEASIVAHNLLHPNNLLPVDYHAMPHAVFGSPQVAAVGMTEEEAGKRGSHYAVGRAAYSATAYGESIDEHDGFVKVIADAHSREILGCHIIGPEAAVLIQEVANAMRRHETTEAITRSIYVHPAPQEVVSDAFASIEWQAA